MAEPHQDFCNIPWVEEVVVGGVMVRVVVFWVWASINGEEGTRTSWVGTVYDVGNIDPFDQFVVKCFNVDSGWGGVVVLGRS